MSGTWMSGSEGMMSEDTPITEVYVVTSGSYSDYSIVAIYSDRVAADQRVAGESSYHSSYPGEYRVEVHTLNATPAFAGVVWTSQWWATETVLSERDRPAAVYKIWYEGNDPGNA